MKKDFGEIGRKIELVKNNLDKLDKKYSKDAQAALAGVDKELGKLYETIQLSKKA